MITEDDARRMGETGAPPTEEERKLFEAWMRGHNWKISGEWDGKQYRHASEHAGDVHPPTMNTRQLFAAWRDRGALTAKSDPLENIGDAIERAIGEAPVADVLAIVTGAFVGLTAELVRRQGHNPDEQIKIDGGPNRDITIHAKKDTQR